MRTQQSHHHARQTPYARRSSANGLSLAANSPHPTFASQSGTLTPASGAWSVSIPAEPSQSEAGLYREVLRLIGETHQFLDDITATYFQQGIHRFLPVISRIRFQRSLITLGSVPSAGFSVLLLAICLPKVDRESSFYLATKSICAQVQRSFAPSIHLIQARLLLTLHEYVQGRPEEAFEAIAGCARMAYAARIHRLTRSSTAGDLDAGEFEDPDLHLQEKEAANTWWGIAICER